MFPPVRSKMRRARQPPVPPTHKMRSVKACDTFFDHSDLGAFPAPPPSSDLTMTRPYPIHSTRRLACIALQRKRYYWGNHGTPSHDGIQRIALPNADEVS